MAGKKNEMGIKSKSQVHEIEKGKGGFATWSARIPVKEVYTYQDLEDAQFDYSKDLGLPGEFPYTRGIDPNMYRRGLWNRDQISGYGLPEQSNERLRYLMDSGATSFYITMDLPTQLGYDSDDPMVTGEVGKIGVAIDSLRDYELLFKDIPLSSLHDIRTSWNAIGPIGLAMFIALCEKQGVSPEKCTVVLQNDILKEYIARGTWIFPPEPAVKLAVDVIEYCAKNLPKWRPMQISVAHMRSAGANVAQELGFGLANAVAYIEAAIARGLNVDDFAPQFDCLLGIHSLDIFEEIAKIRAWRKLWANMLKRKFGAQNDESLKLKLHILTSGIVQTAQEPLNNIARIAIQALAIVLSGAQTIGTCGYDEAISIPSAEAARIAVRTQEILAYETGLVNTVDPLGGSYYLEWMTKEIEKRALNVFEEVEKLGGSLAAIEQGHFQKEIAREAFLFEKDLESGRKKIVTVNVFRVEEPLQIKSFKVSPEVEEVKVATLKELKRSRDNERQDILLRRVKKAAIMGENLVPPILEAVREYVTVGEITGVLREVYGEYRPIAWKV